MIIESQNTVELDEMPKIATEYKYGRACVVPDPRYSSILLHKFANNLMWDGKKNIIFKAIYIALEQLEKDGQTDEANGGKKMTAVEILEKVITLVTPDYTVQVRRVGNSNYPIPIDMKSSPYLKHKAKSIAIKWIVNAIRGRKAMALSNKIHTEFKAILTNSNSAALTQKITVQKTADANKAFAHMLNRNKKK